eukprot:c19997_g1_i4.p2 GENE.c19997_g1_i4~~c19997_g1_i4.p2  ORF type:complete len:104 (+),score=27.60 c19997_g1_i4:380-691(+)
MTLYSRALPVDTAARIWDLYMLHRDDVLFRTALAILKLLWPNLQSCDFDSTILLLKNVHEFIEVEALVRTIAQINIRPTAVDEMLNRYIQALYMPRSFSEKAS